MADGVQLAGVGVQLVPASAELDVVTSISAGNSITLTPNPIVHTGTVALSTTPNIGTATGSALSLGGGTNLLTTNQSGTGSLALTNSPQFATPFLGLATGSSLALGGATIGANALAITGASLIGSSSDVLNIAGNTLVVNLSGNGGFNMWQGMPLSWVNSNNALTGTSDLFLTRRGAASLQVGAADAPSPVAQTIQPQGSRSGTDVNTAGANLTIQSGGGTGTATGSSLLLLSPVAVGSGSGAQTQTRGAAVNNGSLICGPGSALTTTATLGFVYLPTCAGTPTGVPKAQTGAVAAVYDTTGDILWVYNGSWKQPKTVGTVLVVDWV